MNVMLVLLTPSNYTMQKKKNYEPSEISDTSDITNVLHEILYELNDYNHIFF